MNKIVRFFLVAVTFISLNSCGDDDEGGYLENYIEIDGEIHTINGGITNWGSEINEDLTWHFGSIVTLYGDGIDYDPGLRKFKGKGFVIRIRFHTIINGLGPGDYTYSESEDEFTLTRQRILPILIWIMIKTYQNLSLLFRETSMWSEKINTTYALTLLIARVGGLKDILHIKCFDNL